jgi:ElaB/YqjD/DUF883 family membrane-anchored ribosome-binding protein
MDPEPEVIRQQIEETRSSLADKLSSLEGKVVDTVKETTDAVADTVESVKESVTGTVEAVTDTVQDTVTAVKETVQDTVAAVKDAFDLRHHVDQYPWLMVSGSCVAGFLAGKLLGRFDASHAPAQSTTAASYPSSLAPRSAGGGSANGAQADGLVEKLVAHFGGELTRVRELAVGTLFGVLRDLAKRALPEHLAPQVAEVVDRVTSKLGGKPIEGPLVSEPSSESRAAQRGEIGPAFGRRGL